MYSFRNVTKILSHQSNLKASLFFAICLVLMAVLLLDLMGVIIKYLAPKYSIVQMQIARNSFGLLPVIILLYFTVKPKVVSQKFTVSYKLLAIFRGLSVVFAQVCFYLALSRLDFAVVSTLVFTGPIFLVLLSVVILRSSVDRWRWLAVFSGFLGIIIIVRPGSELFSLNSLLPLFAAIGYAMSNVLIKKFPKEVSIARIQIYAQLTTLFSVLVYGVLFSSLTYVTLYDFFLLALMGILGGSGVICFICAYRMTEPSTIAPFEYFGLPISFLLGWWFFMEAPFEQLFPGIIAVVLGGLIIAWREGRK